MGATPSLSAAVAWIFCLPVNALAFHVTEISEEGLWKKQKKGTGGVRRRIAYLGVRDETVLLHPGLDERAVDLLPVMVELLLREAWLALQKGDADDRAGLSLARGGDRLVCHGFGIIMIFVFVSPN